LGHKPLIKHGLPDIADKYKCIYLPPALRTTARLFAGIRDNSDTSDGIFC